MANRKKFRSEWNRDNSALIWLPVIVVLVLIGVGGYYLWPYGNPLSERTAITEKPPTEPTQAPAEQIRQEPKYPLPDSVRSPAEAEPAADASKAEEAGGSEAESAPEAESEPEPLPSLADSDGPLRNSLHDVIASKRFEDLFIPESLVRHFVVTIDNMTRAKLPQKFSFTRPPPDTFKVEEIEDGRYRIDPENYERYRPYVVLVETVNPDRLVSIYIRYYPLFQQAYEELGYPDRYFNDRLIEVIDHLLAAPEPTRPIELVRPKVFYEFADDRLEALSAGQKLLIRIGPENAARVKAVLREYRAKLTGVEPDQQE